MFIGNVRQWMIWGCMVWFRKIFLILALSFILISKNIWINDLSPWNNPKHHYKTTSVSKKRYQKPSKTKSSLLPAWPTTKHPPTNLPPTDYPLSTERDRTSRQSRRLPKNHPLKLCKYHPQQCNHTSKKTILAKEHVSTTFQKRQLLSRNTQDPIATVTNVQLKWLKTMGRLWESVSKVWCLGIFWNNSWI